MEIRTSADVLKAFLGVSSPASPRSRQVENTLAANQQLIAGDKATLSEAGSQVVQVSDQTCIRAEKVAAIQKALASGTYNVPAMTVASKVIDAMLSGGIAPNAPQRGASCGQESQ